MTLLKCLSICFLLAFTAHPVSLADPVAQRMTIIDYYLKLPQQFLSDKTLSTREARESGIWLQDSANNYLELRDNARESYQAFTTFKRADGSDLIAIESRSCPRGCSSALKFLTFDGEHFTDITAAILPAIDVNSIRSYILKERFDASSTEPQLLYTIVRGGSAIEVRDHWSGLEVGKLEWSGERFSFVTLSTEEIVGANSVLASVDNPSGDRISIIAVSPQLPAKLPINGFVAVKIAYELKSRPSCVVFATGFRSTRPDMGGFTSGSIRLKKGTGVVTRWFGYGNENHLDQMEVSMKDENIEPMLSIPYPIDVTWQGILECPTFHVNCTTDSKDSAIPRTCWVLPSGLGPQHRLTYTWSLSTGTIVSGQGTQTIRIDTNGQEYVTATVDVGGLSDKCVSKAFMRVNPQIVSRPSK